MAKLYSLLVKQGYGAFIPTLSGLAKNGPTHLERKETEAKKEGACTQKKFVCLWSGHLIHHPCLDILEHTAE